MSDKSDSHIYRLREEIMQQEVEMHRLRTERDALQKSVEEWEAKELTWFASPEAAKRLDGYRELAEQANKAAAERDALLEALKRYVDHFGDPLKCARAAIAKAQGGGNG